MIETKFQPLDFKRHKGNWRFKGYASLFDKEDAAGDIVARGAFKNSLSRRSSSQVKLLYQHDPSEPIGVWEDIHEDEKGLFVAGRLIDGVPKAASVLALMTAGALDGLSIGFRTISAERDAKGRRRLTDIDLWEISVVTFPMLAEARAQPPQLDHEPTPDLSALLQDASHEIAS